MTLDNEQIASIRKRCKKKDIGFCCGLYAEMMNTDNCLPNSIANLRGVEIELDGLQPEIKSKKELERELVCCIRRVAKEGLSEGDIIRVMRREISRLQKYHERRKKKVETEPTSEHAGEKELAKV